MVFRVAVSVVLLLGPWVGLGTACASCTTPETASDHRPAAPSIEQADCCHASAEAVPSSGSPASSPPIPCHLKSCCVQFAPVGADASSIVGERPVADLKPANDGRPETHRDRPPVPPPRDLTRSV
jgi:hypothetical protein